MLLQRFPAMGTEVVAMGESEIGLGEVPVWFEQVEACCSRFRPDSDLSRVNRYPSDEVPLPALLEEVLRVAAAMRAATCGLVDVGVGRAVRDWGYDRSFAEVVPRATPPEAAGLPVWEVSAGRLRRSAGTAIDLGGLAKGWACDRAVESGLATVVSAGGDLRSADGRTRVEVLGADGEVAGRLHLGVGALATSSVLRRRWKAGAAEAHHIIDPRTMSPAVSPVVSATAVTATAVEAEAAAKAILLLGADGLAWADRQPWVRGALVIWHDGGVYATTDLEAAA